MKIQDYFQPLYKRILVIFPIVYFLTRILQTGMGYDPWHPYFLFLILPLTWYFLQKKYKWFEEKNYIFVEVVAGIVVLHAGLLWLMNIKGTSGDIYFAIFFNAIFLSSMVFHSIWSVGLFFSFSILLSLILLIVSKRTDMVMAFTGTLVGMGCVQVVMLMNRIITIKKLIASGDERDTLEKEIENIKHYKDIVFDNMDYKYVLINNTKTIIVASMGFLGANHQVRNWCIGKHLYTFLDEKSNLKSDDIKKFKGLLDKESSINGKPVKYKNFTFKKIKTDLSGMYNILIVER